METVTDVTDTVDWRLEKAHLGAFSDSTFTTTTGTVGETLLFAKLDAIEGEAVVTVRSETILVDDSVAPEAPNLFDQATVDEESDLAFAYPEDGTVFPPNLKLLRGSLDRRDRPRSVRDIRKE